MIEIVKYDFNITWFFSGLSWSKTVQMIYLLEEKGILTGCHINNEEDIWATYHSENQDLDEVMEEVDQICNSCRKTVNRLTTKKLSFQW